MHVQAKTGKKGSCKTETQPLEENVARTIKKVSQWPYRNYGEKLKVKTGKKDTKSLEARILI